MIYIGEWEQEDFIKNSTNGDGLSLLKELLIDELKNNVENYEALWEDLGYETAAFAFKCSNCGKNSGDLSRLLSKFCVDKRSCYQM